MELRRPILTEDAGWVRLRPVPCPRSSWSCVRMLTAGTRSLRARGALGSDLAFCLRKKGCDFLSEQQAAACRILATTLNPGAREIGGNWKGNIFGL